MQPQTIRTGLTAAMTAGRALLAAGWRYDSTTPMADDTTIRTLLHPSGRQIDARTVDGGEMTALTMTGLTLDQAAGAIAGAGLVEPAEESAEGEHRHAAGWKGGPGECAASCACGVTYDGFDSLGEASALLDRHIAAEQPKGEPTPRQRFAAELHRIADDIVTQQLPLGRLMSATLSPGVLDSRADLDRWATYLGSPVRIDSNGIPFTEAQIRLGKKYGPSLTVGAQTRQEHPSEVERLRARVAELEAQQVEGGATR